MAVDIGSFQVDLRPNIQGYQDQINNVKRALEKIGKDTTIGQDIAKSLKLAESQVNSLGRTLEKRISSESQITALTDRLHDIDKLFIQIGESIKRVSWDDLGTDALRDQINGLSNEVTKISQQIQTNITQGIKNSLQETTEEGKRLKTVFDNLKINPDKMNADQITGALTAGLAQARSETEAARKELESLQQKANDAAAAYEKFQSQAAMQVAGGSVGLRTELNDLFTQLTLFEQLDASNIENYVNKINSAFSALPEKGKKDVQSFTSALDDLKKATTQEEVISAVTKLNTAFQRNGGGNLANQVGIAGNIRDLQNELTKSGPVIQDSLIALADNLQDFLAKYNNLGMSEGQVDSLVTRLLNPDATQKEIEQAQTVVKAALDQYMKNLEQQSSALLNVRTKAEAAVVKASSTVQEKTENQALIESAQSDFSARVSALETQNADLRAQVKGLQTQLTQLRNEQQQRNNANGRPLSEAGAGISSKAIQSYKQAEEGAKAYSAQLEIVKQREQMIGNIQSFVQRWFSVYAAARMVQNAFNSMKQTVQELDDVMTEIAIVTDKTQASLWDQMPEYSAMAKEYAASIKGVYQVSQLYYQQG